jgi:hypothetical protein
MFPRKRWVSILLFVSISLFTLALIEPQAGRVAEITSALAAFTLLHDSRDQ